MHINQNLKKSIIEKSYYRLINNNKQWASEKLQLNPEYFSEMANGQSPQYLWIGCSDSRVPANEITKTQPGEIFVHRNVANMVEHCDMNMLSVLSYAVEILKVKHIIVCGHYGCGGIQAAMGNNMYGGVIDHWLGHIKDVYQLHQSELDAIEDQDERFKRFVEINTIEQAHDLGKTSIVQNAWKRNQPLHIHAWVYDLKTGLLNELDTTLTCTKDLHTVYQLA